MILYCQDDLADHLAVLALNVDGTDSGGVGALLDVDNDIVCRTGLHCALLVHGGSGTAEIRVAVRLSTGPFNTEEHIEAAINGVQGTAGFSHC